MILERKFSHGQHLFKKPHKVDCCSYFWFSRSHKWIEHSCMRVPRKCLSNKMLQIYQEKNAKRETENKIIRHNMFS